MTWYQKFVLSFLSAALTVISTSVESASFRKTYQSVLRQFVETAEMIKPFLEEDKKLK